MSEDLTKRVGDQSSGRFDELFSMVQAIRAELSDLKQNVSDLGQTVDARLYDTRPIWEKVQTDIAGIQDGQKSLAERQMSFAAGQQRLEERQQRLEERIEALRDEMRTGFRNLKRQFSILNDTFLEVRADYKDLDNRVYKLEGERN